MIRLLNILRFPENVFSAWLRKSAYQKFCACLLVAWLVGDYLLLRDFDPYVIIFMNVSVVLTVAVLILLRDFGPCGITFDYVFAVLECRAILDR
jgi:hypothetical protein